MMAVEWDWGWLPSCPGSHSSSKDSILVVLWYSGYLLKWLSSSHTTLIPMVQVQTNHQVTGQDQSVNLHHLTHLPKSPEVVNVTLVPGDVGLGL